MPIKADIPIAWWAQHKSFKCHDRTQLIPNPSKQQENTCIFICCSNYS